MDRRLQISDLADGLARRSNMPHREAENFVRQFLSAIEQGLLRENIVRVRSLGSFKLVDIDAREAVSVQNGERIEIAGHTRVSFTPDAVLRDAVNKPFAEFQTVVLGDDVDLSLIEALDHAATPPSSPATTAAPAPEPSAPASCAPAPGPQAAPALAARPQTPAPAAPQPASAAPAPGFDPAAGEQAGEPTSAADTAAGEQAGEPASAADTSAGEQAGEPTSAADTAAGEQAGEPASAADTATAEKAGGPAAEAVSPAPETTHTVVHNATIVEEAQVVRHAGQVHGADRLPRRHHGPWHLLAACLLSVLLFAAGYVAGSLYPLALGNFPARQVAASRPEAASSKPRKSTSKAAASKPRLRGSRQERPQTSPQDQPLPPQTPAPSPAAAAPSSPADAASQGQPSREAAPPTRRQPSEILAYPQVEGGEYYIVGIKANDVMTAGKTLLNLSIKYYGSTAFVPYICAMNGIKTPDVVPLNMELKIPELRHR